MNSDISLEINLDARLYYISSDPLFLQVSNSIAKITVFRARIMKTYAFHRVTVKAPNLFRRWHLICWCPQVFVLMKIKKLTNSEFGLTKYAQKEYN